MSKLWKKSCTKVNQITRKMSADLHSSSRRVKPSFPTFLGDLFLKNRSCPNNSSPSSSKKISSKKHNNLSSSLSSSSASESTSPLYSQSPSPLLPPRHSCANSRSSASIIEEQPPPPPKCSGKIGGEFATLNASRSIFGNDIDSTIEKKGNRDLEAEVRSDATLAIAAYDHEEKYYYNDDSVNYTVILVSVLKVVVVMVTIVLIMSLYTKKFAIGITFASFSLIFLGRLVYLLKPKQKFEFLFCCRWFWFRPISIAEASMAQHMRESLEGEEENDVRTPLMRQSQESGDSSFCNLRSPWNLIEPREGSSKLEINGTQIVQPNFICFGKVEGNGITSSKSYIDLLKNILEVGKIQGVDEKDRMAGGRDGDGNGNGKMKKNNFWKKFIPKQLRHRKKSRMEGCQSNSYNVVVCNSSDDGNCAQNNEEENGAKNQRKDKVDDEYANDDEFMKLSLMEEEEEKEEADEEGGEGRNKGFDQIANDKGLWKHVYSFAALLSTGHRYGVEPIEIIRCRRRNSLKRYYCIITVIVSVLVGLMAGRIFALALTVICCFFLKWSKSSIILL